jgi:hypothetical protein
MKFMNVRPAKILPQDGFSIQRKYPSRASRPFQINGTRAGSPRAGSPRAGTAASRYCPVRSAVSTSCELSGAGHSRMDTVMGSSTHHA